MGDPVYVTVAARAWVMRAKDLMPEGQVDFLRVVTSLWFRGESSSSTVLCVPTWMHGRVVYAFTRWSSLERGNIEHVALEEVTIFGMHVRVGTCEFKVR